MKYFHYITIFLAFAIAVNNMILFIGVKSKTAIEYIVKTEVEKNLEKDTDTKDSNTSSYEEFENYLFSINISLFSQKHCYNNRFFDNYSFWKLSDIGKPPLVVIV